MNIAVVGTGYVGLVTGTCLADTGNHVICVDIDEAKVAAMQAGKVPIYEPNLDSLFERNIAAGRLEFTTILKEAIDRYEAQHRSFCEADIKADRNGRARWEAPPHKPT
ncbi:MAG: hypothetical protein ACPH97_06160, partial [Flavobacteriales bacterium]